MAVEWIALLVAASLLVGALTGLRLSEQVAALLSSFGGGLLLSAVAFELVPEADAEAGPVWTAIGLLAGAALYVGADAWLTRNEHTMEMRRSGHAAAAGQMEPRRQMTADATRVDTNRNDASRGEAIAAGIVVDGVPESLALGLMVAGGEPGLALLTAVVVGNLTESYGAAQPILAGGRSRRFAVGLLGGIGVLLAAMTFVGGTLGDAMLGPSIGVAQAVAAGAVLAVLSISVVPYAFQEVSSRVALATTLGFSAGYLLS